MRPILFHLCSDYGSGSIETTIAQAAVYSIFPNIPIVLGPQDFSKDSFLPAGIYMSGVLNKLTMPAVHLLDLNIDAALGENFILAVAGNQFIFAPDNGVISIALENFDYTTYRIKNNHAFPHVFQDIYVPFLETWLKEKEGNLDGLIAVTEIKRFIIPKPHWQENRARLTVIHTDAQGNAYFNMKKKDWQDIVANKAFKITVTKSNVIQQISPAYSAVATGQILAIFEPGGYLQLAQNQGSMRTLLGLEVGRQVMLEVSEEVQKLF